MLLITSALQTKHEVTIQDSVSDNSEPRAYALVLTLLDQEIH